MLLRCWTGAVIVFLLAPLVVIVLFSFGANDITALPLRGLSLKWYVKLATSREIIAATVNSLLIAVSTAVLATLLGALAAIALYRMSRKMAGALRAVLATPMAAPRLVVGVALLSAYHLMDVRLSLATVIVGHVVIAIPYVVLIVSARLAGLDPKLEEAARDLGANGFAVVCGIYIPLLAPALVSAALVAFTISFDEVVITFFTTGTENTLPTTIWSMLRFGITPEINAVSTLTMALTIAVSLIAERLISLRRPAAR